MVFLKEPMTPPALRATSPLRGEAIRLRHRTRRALLYWCFLAPSLAIFLLYRIIPIVWNLVLSFQYWSPLSEAEPAGFDPPCFGNRGVKRDAHGRRDHLGSCRWAR